MKRQIIKQPNGRYALWSSIMDNFLITNATPEEIINYEVKQFRRDFTEKMERMVADKDMRRSLDLTFEAALKIIREIHGKKEADRVVDDLDLFEKYKGIFDGDKL